jgi:hypothetical protein
VTWEPQEGPGPGGGDEPAGGTVTVRCSPARSITLVANATKGGRLNAGPFGMALRARRLGHAEMGGEHPRRHRPEGVIEGDLLTGGIFTLTGAETYARVQVEDERGRMAWTNPLFVSAPAE